eukprot:9619546-Prorocentrum_lima.AAC.1
MTSSLVGSEMCIRDRCRQVTDMVLDASVVEELSRMAAQRKAMMSREGAVSYTHLTLPTICSV